MNARASVLVLCMRFENSCNAPPRQLPDKDDDMSAVGMETGAPESKSKVAPSTSGGSSVGENEPKRVTAHRQLLKFIPNILHKEKKKLLIFQARVTLFMILLVALETAAFVFAVFFVFSDVAADDIKRVTTISTFRSHALKCGYLQRDLQLAATTNMSASIPYSRNTMVTYAKMIESENFELYRAVQGVMKSHIQNTKFLQFNIVGQEWKQEYNTYFALVSDFVRRIKSSSNVTIAELLDSNFLLGKMTDAKTDIVYVQENMFRGISLLFESLGTLYDDQLITFINLTQQLVAIVASIAGLSVLFFSIFILTGIIRYVHTIKYKVWITYFWATCFWITYFGLLFHTHTACILSIPLPFSPECESVLIHPCLVANSVPSPRVLRP